jgi:M6 family metalloprotease-like protein
MRPFLLGTLALVTACSSSTEPAPNPDIDPDIGRWPYRRSANGVRFHGITRILVIPARYRDGLPEPVSAAAIRDSLFGGTNGGAIAEAYRIASESSFTLRGDVAPWVRTTIAATADLTTASDFIAQAIEAADPSVDFRRYDNDGPDGIPNSGDDDGVVDGGIAVMHSEQIYFCPAGGRGPHPGAASRWTVRGEPVATRDRGRSGALIRVGGYTIVPLMECGGARMSTATLAHELGHLLFGLPDLYRIPSGPSTGTSEPWASRLWMIGCWDLMAAGSGWGCGSGTPPFDGRLATFGAWSRVTLGWAAAKVVPIDRDSTYELLPPGRGGTVLRVPITSQQNLLIEYREPGRGDERLPAGGVLIYKVPGLFGVTLIEADDDSALTRTERDGGNRGAADDAFGRTVSMFRSGSHSQAVGFNGTPLPVIISDITVDPINHRARVRVAPASNR